MDRSLDETIDHDQHASAGKRPEEADLPRSFGRYRVLRELGHGGFGTVFLGCDDQLGREVAIKVAFGHQARGVSAFLEEARHVARLKHPGIVTIYDLGVEQGHCYIVSELLDGTSLDRWLRHHRPSWVESARIVQRVCEALAHAHAQGTVHRDIKPANIILASDLTPTVVDFGLAISDEQQGKKLGEISGTPAYMSPEQTEGRAHRIDGRTDIFSLGVVLYELICGRLPFRAKDVYEQMRQIRDDDPQPPRQLVPELPVELERICLKALSKRMSDRFTTAGDFAASLGRVIEESSPERATSAHADCAPPRTSEPAPTGSSLLRGSLEAERRQLTFLFCSCEPVDAAEVTDPEIQQELLQQFQTICQQAAQRFGGTLIQSSGHGQLVCFGYPVSFEDASRRAVRTGQAVLEAFKDLRRRWERERATSLEAWSVVHTGWVVAETANVADPESLKIVGDAPNIVVRMEAAVDPNEVVVSDATYRLIRGYFDCEPLGAIRVKGVPKGLRVYRIAGENEASSRIVASASSGLAPLVGRDREVELLKDRWEQAQDGLGQVVMLVGEPGIGKSRLVHVLQEYVARHGGRVMEWRCSPQHAQSDLYPVVDYLRRSLQFSADDDPVSRIDKVLQHLEEHELGAPEIVTLFLSLLSLPPDERFPPLELSPQRVRELTLEALGDLVREYALEQPLLFVVEDLHWIDPTSLDLLDMLISQVERDSVLVLLTYRSEFQAPWNVTRFSQVALTRLTRRQVGEMVYRATGVSNVAEELLQQIIDRTEGVPLFVEEFTKMLQESGALEPSPGAGTIDEALGRIPATLQDLLMARLDRLESDREVVQLVATVGREVPYPLLRAVSRLSESELQAELAKLADAEILFQRGRVPRARYVFKHALLQDAAYGSLVKASRQAFHRRIAEALTSQFQETVETEPELVAHHFTEAGLAEPAIRFWHLAGVRAGRRSANREAIDHLQRALALLDGVADDPQRKRLELDVQIALAAPLTAQQGYVSPNVEFAYTRSVELSQQLDAVDLLFPALHGLYRFHVVRGDLDRSLQYTEEILRRANALGEPEHIMEAHRAHGLALCYMGHFPAASRHLADGYQMYDLETHRTHAAAYGVDPGVVLLTFHAWSLWYEGFPVQAMDRTHQFLELANRLAHPHSRAFGTAVTATHYQLRGEWRLALNTAKQVIALSEQQGFPYWLAWGKIVQGWAMSREERGTDGISMIRGALDRWQSAGVGLARPMFLMLLAESLMRHEEYDQAWDAVQEALEITARVDDMYAAEVERQHGILLAIREPSDLPGINACFQRALEIARRQQARSLELRAAVSLATWLGDAGQQDRFQPACAEVARIYDGFTEGFDTQDLQAARRLLEVAS